MGISTARQVREGLAELIRFVNDPATATSDLRVVLAECKGFGGQLAVLQADTAAGVSARERHGDGGVGVLAQAAGLHRRDAASQVKTVEKLQELSAVRDALKSGEISMANAKTLATTCDKTSAQQVQQDEELLAKAAVLSPGQFAREAGRWAAKRQTGGIGGSATGGTGDSGSGGTGGSGGMCGCGGRASADITIVQHLSADGTEAFAEIAGGAAIPPSVLEEHFCNARIKGVVFSSEGMPLWHGHAKRRATKAQMNALRARYGACGGCGADMWICDGHHIEPVSQGGRTDIDNLMLLCWICHQKVHHHEWRVVPDGRGLYTIAPPERIRHGPAHAPDPPSAHGPPARNPGQAGTPEAARPQRRKIARPKAGQPSSVRAESLFTGG